MLDLEIVTFSPDIAFERNRGLISASEQRRLLESLVAIAGCGGGGGAYATTLARLGVGRFRTIDPDAFALVNFNRQVGASMETLGRNKAAVTAEQIRAINPDAGVEALQDRITGENAAAFVRGADLVIDGIDFFSIAARRHLFAAAREAKIPALTAAPLGFSATLHVFAPGGLSFDEYFDLSDGQSSFDQLVRFALGLAPAGLHRSYMDLASVDPKSGRGPSSIIGIELAASLVGAEAVRILLRRGPSRPAPHYLQFDAYRRKFRRGRLTGGNRNLRQRVKRALFVRSLRRLGWDRTE